MTPVTAMGKPRQSLAHHLASSHSAHRWYSLYLNLSVLIPGSFLQILQLSFLGCFVEWLEIT